MQKSDSSIQDGFALLATLEETALRIKELLCRENLPAEITEEEIAWEINQIYTFREDDIIALKRWYNTPAGRLAAAESAEWKQRVDTLVQADKENMELLNWQKQYTGQQLRSIMQNKSVLVYNKVEGSQ
jgi:hypothetical protein